MNKIQKGFTLAEVLITLGIIGVVAALTMPALINKVSDIQYKTAAKKAYSSIQNAYNLAMADNGESYRNANTIATEDLQLNHEKFIAIKNKMNVIKSCPYNTGSFGKCWANTGVGNPNAVPTTCQGFIVSFQNQNESFITADGMAFMFYSYGADTGSRQIAIDTNGLKKPNQWGKDAFVVTIGGNKIEINTSGCTYPNSDGTVITDFSFLLK